MLVTARPRRDPFIFSLGGMKGISASTLVPAISVDRINRSLDVRFQRQPTAKKAPSALIRRIEDALARFYATGYCPDR